MKLCIAGHPQVGRAVRVYRIKHYRGRVYLRHSCRKCLAENAARRRRDMLLYEPDIPRLTQREHEGLDRAIDRINRKLSVFLA